MRPELIQAATFPPALVDCYFSTIEQTYKEFPKGLTSSERMKIVLSAVFRKAAEDGQRDSGRR